MSASLWDFAEVEAVYARLRPRTPYGRRSVEQRLLLTDAAKLEARYDGIALVLSMLDAAPEAADRLRHHLARIPLLPQLGDSPAGTDLFLVRKFLVNCRALAAILPEPARAHFALTWQSDDLLAALDTGGGQQEGFYLGDACSAELGSARRELRAIDAELQALRAGVLNRLQDRYGLDFAHRNFLVIDAARAADWSTDEVFVEPYDSRHVLARPVLARAYLDRLAAREALLQRERAVEQALLRELGQRVRAADLVMEEYVRAIEALDIALAGAELARSLNMTRPVLVDANGTIVVTGGRLVPLQEDCQRRAVAYRPLSVEFDTPHAVLHGSNMTGKSVALKTVAALQMLAQLGLYVPAERFRTPVFERMCFLGSAGTEEARGLSSFGREMLDLQAALAAPARATLLIVDEFARTTSSREATALIAGLLHHLDAAPRTWSLLSTHYTGLPSFPRIRQWRMQGVDWARLRRELAEQPASGRDGVALINRCVPYEMTTGEDAPPAHDAIEIAAMLGLDASIVAFARRALDDPKSERK